MAPPTALQSANRQGITLFPLPSDPAPSANFRAQFNAIAGPKTEQNPDGLDLGIEWTSDRKNPLAVDAKELRIAADKLNAYGATAATPTNYTVQLQHAVTAVLQKLEAKRRERVQAGIASVDWVIVPVATDQLTPAERTAARQIVERVFPIVDRVNARENDPRNPAYTAWMKQNGAEYAGGASMRVYARMQRGVCPGIPAGFNPACSTLPFFPENPPINGMIDPKISAKEFKALAKKLSATAPGDELLRPSTIITKQRGGKYLAVPTPLHPAYRADFQAMASELTAVATLPDLDAAFANQCRALAQYFRTGSAQDEARAAQATIDAGDSRSNLRMELFPSESYWSDNTKFPLLGMVGVRDRNMQQTLDLIKSVWPTLETKIFSGIPHFTPRATVSARGGVADVVRQLATAGYLRSFPVQPAGWNFPNYQQYAKRWALEGSNRYVAVDTLEQSVDSIVTIAQRMLGKTLEPKHIIQYLALFVGAHEAGHLLGVLRDHITPSGVPLGTAFGDHWAQAEEPKADLLVLAIARLLKEEGKLDAAAYHSIVEISSLRIFGRMYGDRGNKKTFFAKNIQDHLFGAVMTAGYGFQQKAYRWDGAKIIIDDDAVAAAGEALLRKIVTFQAAGDVDGFMQFATDCVTAIPDAADAELSKRPNRFCLIEQQPVWNP